MGLFFRARFAKAKASGEEKEEEEEISLAREARARGTEHCQSVLKWAFQGRRDGTGESVAAVAAPLLPLSAA